jgi:vitamin B12 transporter
VSLGADVLRDQVSGTTDYDKASRRDTGVFARYFGQFGANDIELAARHDDDEQFGDHTTGSAAWGYDLTSQWRLLASYGTAFKAPTFNDLYWPADPVWGGGGNPDLKPERSRTADVGVQGAFKAGHWSAHAFETRVDDLIAYDFATSSSQNISKARIRGLELAAGILLFGWDANLALTFLDPESRASGTEGNQLQRRSKRTARADLDRRVGAFGFGGSLLAASKSYDDLANTRELGGYGLLDLRASYAIGKDWRVQGKVGNVFDKDYETASFYNQPGRTWFLILHYAPGSL